MIRTAFVDVVEHEDGMRYETHSIHNRGTVDSHTIDVAVACTREKLGTVNWLTAYPEPLSVW